MTAAELRLWLHVLRDGPVRVRRQVPLVGYIADFYIHTARLVIEIDGDVHDSQEARDYDAARSAVLSAHGFRVLRFRNEQVMHDLNAVREELTPYLTKPLPPTRKRP